MLDRLRQWLLCSRGAHLWLDYETEEGDVFTWCLWCGDEGEDE